MNVVEWARSVAAKLTLRRCASVGARVVVEGDVRIAGGDRIFIGDDVVLDGRRAPIDLNATPGGTIRLGDRVHVDGGVSIESAESITIGSDVQLDGHAKLIDSPFHSVSDDRHVRPPPTPVVVGDRTTIGWRAVILPGARLGRGVTVGPNTVVSRAVPDECAISGSPPRLMRA